MSDNHNKIKRMTLTAMLFGVAIVLTLVESWIPLPIGVPGVKLGLANIVVMYCVIVVGEKHALGIVLLKSFFVLITRGGVAMALSLTGGMMSLVVMIILMGVFKDKISYLLLSVCGAIAFNAGQVIAVSAIYSTINMVYFFPLLLIAAVGTGILTATLLNAFMPMVQRMRLR
jgi:heptaprenyl diphosphate synthase